MSLDGIVLKWLCVGVPTGLSADEYGETGMTAADLGKWARREPGHEDATNAQIAGRLRSFAHHGLAIRDGSKNPRWWPTPAAVRACEALGALDDGLD